MTEPLAASTFTQKEREWIGTVFGRPPADPDAPPRNAKQREMDEKAFEKKKREIILQADVGPRREQMQTEFRKEIASEIGKERDKIAEAMQIDAQKMPKGFAERMRQFFANPTSIALAAKDPADAFDTWRHGMDFEIPAKQLRALQDAFQKIAELSIRMREATIDETGLPLYTDTEIAEELWRPLQREGVLPENFIPNRYSEVSRTFQGANALYTERLKKWTDETTQTDRILHYLKPVEDVGSELLRGAAAGSTAAAGVFGCINNVEDLSDSEDARDLVELSNTLKLADTVYRTTGTITKGVLQDHHVVGMVDAFNNALRGVLRAAEVDDDLAGMIFMVISASARAKTVQEAIARNDVEGSLLAVGAAIENGMRLNDPGDPPLSEIGSGIQVAIAGVVAANRVKKGDWQGALAPLAAGLAAAGKGTARYFLDEENAGEAEERTEQVESGAYSEGEAEQRGRITDAFYRERLGGTADAIDDLTNPLKEFGKAKGGLRGKPLSEDQKRQLKARKLLIEEEAGQTAGIEMNRKMNAPDPAYEALLGGAFGSEAEAGAMDAEARLTSMDTLIASLKRDRKIFELCEKFLTGGPRLVAAMFPPAAAAASGMKLLFTITEAVRRTQHLTKWIASYSDAKGAGTVQADAMLSELGLQSRQEAQTLIRVGLQAIQVVGDAMKPAGQVAPVGFAISGAAAGAESLLNIAIIAFDQAEMQLGWSLYQKARNNPDDRIAARRAFRHNPTLAKYAMAYGALVENEPTARKAFARCGLNEETLANKTTNAQKVVEYLELLYEQDPIILRGVSDNDKWHPGRPELTLKSWMLFTQAAQNSSDIKPKLDPKAKVGAVNAAMVPFEKANRSFTALDQNTAPLRQAAFAIQKHLQESKHLHLLLQASADLSEKMTIRNHRLPDVVKSLNAAETTLSTALTSAKGDPEKLATEAEAAARKLSAALGGFAPFAADGSGEIPSVAAYAGQLAQQAKHMADGYFDRAQDLIEAVKTAEMVQKQSATPIREANAALKTL